MNKNAPWIEDSGHCLGHGRECYNDNALTWFKRKEWNGWCST